MAIVVAGSPVRNRAWIVGRSIHGLRAAGANEFFYLVNDCEDDTEDVLWQEGADFKVLNTGEPGWHRGNRKKGWHGDMRYQFDNLAKVRNAWREHLLEFYPEATHYWSCDSDIVPDADCLQYLLDADKPCIGARIPSGQVSFNFMLGRDDEGPRRNREEHEYVKRKEPFEVTLTGACMLIRRDVLESVQWDYHQRGEDIPFSEACTKLGYGPWLHPLARGTHYMGDTPDEVWR